MATAAELASGRGSISKPLDADYINYVHRLLSKLIHSKHSNSLNFSMAGTLCRPLATEEQEEHNFSWLMIKTPADTNLNEAKKAFKNGDYTRSANLFLESWRILQNEYERNFYEPSSEETNTSNPTSKNRARMRLSCFALHDLAKACFQNMEEYRDEEGNCKLNVYARYDWSRDTIAEALDIDSGDNGDRPISIGSPITALKLQLQDPMGRLLDTADDFQHAAYIVAHLVSRQIACVSNPLKYYEYFESKRSSLGPLMMRDRGVRKDILARIARKKRSEQIRDNQNDPEDEKDEKDEKARQKLIPKMKELKSKESSIKKEEEEELLTLFKKQCHIGSDKPLGYARFNKGLEQFHVIDYDSPSFVQMQKENNDNEEEDGDGKEGNLVAKLEDAEDRREEEEMKKKEMKEKEVEMKKKEEEMRKKEEEVKKKEEEMKEKRKEEIRKRVKEMEDEELSQLFQRL
jgi:hypothetical protein